MISLLRATLVAIVLSCTTVTPTLAQTPEAQALGIRIAKRMISSMELSVALAEGIGKNAGSLNIAKSRPEWNELLVQSFRKEIVHDQPAFEALLGRKFVQSMTLDELRAGAEILDDPGMLKAMAAAAKKEPPPRQDLTARAQKIAETPAGRSFTTKLNNFGEIVGSLQDELIVELLPGSLRRFGEAAEAMEAERAR